MRPEFESPNPDFERAVRQSFAKQSAMSSLKISIEALGPGWTEFALQKSDDLTQQHGFVHAGVLGAALDSACGYAAYSLMPPEAAVLTAEYTINLLRPASADRFIVKGWVVKPGRTLTVCQGEAISAPDGELVAIMTATIMTVVGRDIEG